MSSKNKSSKPKTEKKKGNSGSTTVSLSGDRLTKVNTLMEKLSKKAGVEVKRVSVVNRLIDEGYEIVRKQM